MLLAFDLDGTLLDTREAVHLAYVQAGVTPPVDWWGLPWQAWLTDAAAHERKNAIYEGLVHTHVRPLPLLHLANAHPHDYYILTGCSARAYSALARHFALQPKDVFLSLTLERRVERLRQLGATGLYFDDHPTTARVVQQQTGWQSYIPVPL